MEARIGRESLHFYGMAPSDLRILGKRPMEWDLNDWRWDGDLFIASPLNTLPSHGGSQQFFPLGSGIPENGASSNSSSSCSDEVSLRMDNGNRELDKKRRALVVEEDSGNEETGNLTLKLGGHNYPSADKEGANWDRSTGKKTKLGGGTSNRSVCQVEDCGADLSKAKDYHRRHKVCEIHSKASRALVANVMQRFCQQCSRFHVLEEFDEGKRSCRRRLAGHNKRRRKTNNENVPSGSSPNDEQTSSYLLINVLRILSNMHSNKLDKNTDQDLLSHLLKSLASQNGDHGAKNVSSLMLEPQNLLKGSTSAGKSDMASILVSNCSQDPPSLLGKQLTPSEVQHGHKSRDVEIGAVPHTKSSILGSPSAYSDVRESTSGQMKMNNFDLNDIYIDSDDGTEDVERSPATANMGTGFVDYSWAQDSHQSSPPQTSGNSDSASALSPSSSSGEASSRTDRIVFKLFGKEPNDFPPFLRAQMLDWLSHSPTDIESYIRPGCIILTMYLRQSEGAWEDLYGDLSSGLKRLIDVSDNNFWRSGWMFIRVQHQIAIIFNGQVVIDSPLPFTTSNHGKILSVQPIAVSASNKAQFTVKGINLFQPATRLLCSLEGKYLVHKAANELTDDPECSEFDELQVIKFDCLIPSTNGRGFIEIEDEGLSSIFFPFIVVEENVCSEIRVLETLFESDDSYTDNYMDAKLEAKNEAMEFIHEMGWLLHRSQLKTRLSNLELTAEPFPLKRFKWLMEFSVDHDWCAVVRKLLNIMVNGTVGTGEHPSLHHALSEINLLHRAVRKNSRRLVQLLLTFVPENLTENLPEDEALPSGVDRRYLFRPDVVGPAGLTPLHIAAGIDDSEDVLDALTEDPNMVGIEAWKNARDSTGSTPEDYARLRGHYNYIHLVQRKINKSQRVNHVVVEIPSVVTDGSNVNRKENESIAAFEIGKAMQKYPQGQCKLCDHKWTQRIVGSRSVVYRPALLSMVAIAAVCVCVALLFKSAPQVLYPFRPFSWESLDYGII